MRICNAKGCSKEYYAKGYCEIHYRRWVKHGSPYFVYKVNNKGKNNPNWKGGLTKRKYYCRTCGKEISYNSATYGVDLCHPCGTPKGEKAYQWKGGISRLPYPFDFNEELKELIRKRDNYKCQNCGCPQEECYRKLSVHHIDYNKDNLDPENLITLCSSCNSKANFDRSYWQKHFTVEF